MAPQLPAPEKFSEALTGVLSFPPKLSAVAELLAEPERIFEEQASAMGISVPPGPTKTIAQMLQGIESTLPAFTPPGFPAPTSPTTPTTPPASGQGVSLGEAEKVEIEKPTATTTKARERIEIVEA